MKEHRTLLATALSVFIVLTSFYIWFSAYPRFVIREPIANYEQSFYDNNLDSSFQFLAANPHYEGIVRRNLLKINELFSRFEKGFEITSARRIKNAGSYHKVIEATISKVAKIDGMQRDHFQVTIVYTGEQWKIFSYYFPDYIDY